MGEKIIEQGKICYPFSVLKKIDTIHMIKHGNPRGANESSNKEKTDFGNSKYYNDYIEVWIPITRANETI